MTKLTPSAKALIDDAKGGDEPSGAARARIRAKLLTQVGAGVATGAAVGSATAAGAAAKTVLPTGLLVKVLGVLGVAGAIAVGTLVARRGSEPEQAAVSIVATASPSSAAREEPPPTVKSVEARALELSHDGAASGPKPRSPEGPNHDGAESGPKPRSPSWPISTTPAAPGPSTMRTSPSASAAHVAPPREASSAASVSTPAAGGSLEAEMELLRKAQAELREGRPESALAALDAHGAEFKDGVLREERLAAHILALCNLGRTSEARAEAQRFLAASPRSPMAERIRNSCGGETSK